MNRRGLAMLVLGVWLGAVGWLVRREYFRPESQLLAASALNVPPGATFYSVSLNGEQIGFASNTVDTVPDGIDVRDILEIHVSVLGSVQRIHAYTKAKLSRTLSLKAFEAAIRGDATQFVATGQVIGDSLLAVEIETEAGKDSLQIPLSGPIVLPAYLPMRLTFGPGLQVGDSHTITIYDPLLFQEHQIEIAVTRDSTFILPDSAVFDSTTLRWRPISWDTLHAWRLEQRSGNLETVMWVDDLGRMVSSRSPIGFEISRSVYELAYENFRLTERNPSATQTDIISQTAIASNVSLSPDEVSQLKIVIEGVSLEGFDLEGGRQRLHGDTLIISREESDDLDADRLLPNLSRALHRFLQPEPLIQSDDTRIAALARQIVGRRRNARRAAERINRWVHEELVKQVTVGVPSAVQVLASRRGDCNEHTVLFVALARAAGLPARTAAGLVYLDGSFYYHAWPEVYLRGWVAFDPTFGQTPADAAHIRFTIGGLARQVELIRLIGRVSLNVLEVRS